MLPFNYRFKIDKRSKEFILFRNKKYHKIKSSKIYPLDDNEKDQFKCSICFDTLIFGKVILKTECNHIFHKSCLDNWINSKINLDTQCPICRKKINVDKLKFVIT